MKYIKLFENWFNNKGNSIFENFLSPEEHLELLDLPPSVTKSVTKTEQGFTYNASSNKAASNNSNSGNCTTYVEQHTDRFSGEISKISKKHVMVFAPGQWETGFGIAFFQSKGVKDGVLLSFTVQKDGIRVCFDLMSEVIILFTDNSKITCVNVSKNNCKGSCQLFALKNPPTDVTKALYVDLIKLKTKKIQAIRIVTSDGVMDEDFTVENQDQFLNTINCFS